jgi:hypothetical protein
MVQVVELDVLGGTASEGQRNMAAGAFMPFGVRIVSRSIWILTRPGASRVLPIVALAITAVCGLAFAGSV